MASINSNRETVLNQLSSNNSISTVGVEVMAAKMGVAPGSGETVRLSSREADINDMKEEVGMMKATLKTVDLSKLKMRKGAGTDLEALARIAEFYDKLPDLPKDQKSLDLIKKLEKHASAFQDGLSGGGQGSSDLPTAEDVRKALRNYDGDVSHQFAALENARAEFQKAGAPAAFVAILDEVRAEMRSPGTAQDIKAGFASAREATQAPDRFGAKPEDFRESYRQMLRAGGNVGQLFDSLGKFAEIGVADRKAYESVLDSFIRVAGDDMRSFGHSTDKAILADVITELKALKNLRTSLDMCVDMMDKLARMYPDESKEMPGPAQIVSLMLHFVSSSARRDAERIIEKFDKMAPEVPVAATNMITNIHASLPDSLMPSDTARQQQGKVLKAIGDVVVAREEAHHGG